MSNPTREQAEQLAQKYLKDTLRHCQQVGGIMEYFAKELGQDSDYWYIAGLLHDIDRDHVQKDSSKHLKQEFDTIMDEINAPAELRDDMKSHGFWLSGVPVGDSLIRKYLISIDELSGFLHAYSLMRPTKFDGMERSGIKKRLKDKTFAAGVDREHVMNCETYLNIPLETFAMDVVQAMKTL